MLRKWCFAQASCSTLVACGPDKAEAEGADCPDCPSWVSPGALTSKASMDFNYRHNKASTYKCSMACKYRRSIEVLYRLFFSGRCENNLASYKCVVCFSCFQWIKQLLSQPSWTERPVASYWIDEQKNVRSQARHLIAYFTNIGNACKCYDLHWFIVIMLVYSISIYSIH